MKSVMRGELRDLIKATTFDVADLNSILRDVSQSLNVQSVSVLVYQGTTEEIVLRAATAIPDGVPDERYDVEQSLSGSVFALGEPVIVNDLFAHPRTSRKWHSWWSDRLAPHPLRHAVFVPFTADCELRGILRFFNRLDEQGCLADGFSPADIVGLLDVARLFSQQFSRIWVADKFRALSLLSETGTQAPGQQDPLRDAASRIARVATNIANCPAAAVFLLDPFKDNTITLAGSYGFKRPLADLSLSLDRGAIGRSARRRALVEIFDLQTATDTDPAGPGTMEGMKSLLAVPLDATASKLPASGVVAVYSLLRRRFHPSTHHFLLSYAAIARLAIENGATAIQNTNQREAMTITSHSMRTSLERVSVSIDKLRASARDRLIVELDDAQFNLRWASRRLVEMQHADEGLLALTGLKRELVEVNGILASCKARHAPSAARRNIAILLPQTLVPVLNGDRDKLELALDNLVENAVKYSWANEPVRISVDSGGATLRILIHDKGLGVPERLYETIFAPYSRSEILDRTRHIKGTGLGLYVSRLIARAHGGDITVKSSPFLHDKERLSAYDGFDTIFTLSLPLQDV